MPKLGQSGSQCSGQWGLALSPGVGQVTSQPCQSQGTAVAAAPSAELQNRNKTRTEAGLAQPETPQQAHQLISLKKKNLKRKK